jgi:hypothetical protein
MSCLRGNCEEAGRQPKTEISSHVPAAMLLAAAFVKLQARPQNNHATVFCIALTKV